MRRKDWKYYGKTAYLRWNSYQFRNFREQSTYPSVVDARRKEYQEKMGETILEFQHFEPYFTTYFYFEDTSIFLDVYSWKNGFPISLKSSSDENPLLPLYFGLILWNSELSKQSKSMDVFLSIADYTIEKSQETTIGRTIPYQFDYDVFGLKSPWNSGITQSLAVSYFIRIYYETKEEKYMDFAEALFKPCLASTDNGGLLTSTSAGMEWVEEYPSSPQSYVLNGHMFAILAAVELFQCSEKEIYKHHATQWIKSLVYHLPEYQYKEYILHNKYQNKLSNIEYQGLYVGLFKHLYKLTNHPVFMEFFMFYDKSVSWKDFYSFYGINS